MVTFILSQNSPTNTTLSYEDGRAAYVVKTAFRWKDKVTVITRASGEEVARVEWKSCSDELLTLNGKTTKLSEIMPHNKDGLASSNRHFTNKAGEEFRWILDRKAYCVSVTSGATVATFYQSTWGVVGQKKPAYIDIVDEVLGEQDLIVVTCLIMESIRRYRNIILWNGGGWYLSMKPL